MFELGDKEFLCDKCKKKSSTDGSLLNRDPKLSYCICRTCRDELVILLSQAELNTVMNFLKW